MSLFLHWNRFGEIKHCISCSPKDPLQWMGAIRVQTADLKKHSNPQLIHMTPVHQLKLVNNALICIFLSWFKQGDFFHWRKQYYGLWPCILTRNISLFLEHINDDLFLINKQVFTSQYINWSTEVMWITCYVFMSCLDSHSDGTHSLQRIHWWASDVMLMLPKTVPETLHLGWPKGYYIFIFGWTIH